MANTLRFKRGLVSTIPTALAGEPLFTTDTFDLYIGNGTTNTRFQKYIASGTTSQLLRGDGSLLTMPIVLTSPSTGQVLKYNGTNWVNDSDAGITGSGTTNYLPKFTGASTLGNSLVFDNGTNVGIGTASPAYKLDVSGEVRANNLFRTTDGTNIGLFGSSVFAANVIGVGSSNNVPLVFGTNATERARVTSGGNFIINNASSDNGLRFQVTGDGYFSGSVGIGTASPQSKLVVQNASGTAIPSLGSHGGHFQIQNGSYGLLTGVATSGNAWMQVQRTDGTATAYNLILQPTAGNLGLGVTPDQLLHIAKSSTTAYSSSSASLIQPDGGSNLLIQNTGTGGFTSLRFAPLNGSYAVGYIGFINTFGVGGSFVVGQRTGGSSYAEQMRLDASGNLLVGQTSNPYTQANRTVIGLNGTTDSLISMSISGTAAAYLFASSTSLDINANSRPLTFSTTGAEKARIFNNGNFAIGTTTDAGYKLDVNGTMRVSGASTFSSSVTANHFITTTPLLAHLTSAGALQYNANGVSIRAYGATAGTGFFTIRTGGGGGSADVERVVVAANGDVGIDTNTLFVDATNDRVGIGTASPSYKLHIKTTDTSTTIGANIVGRFETSGTNADSTIQLSDGVATASQISHQAGALYLRTANTTRVHLLSNGNFGLGISPNYALDVSGETRVSNAIAIGTTPDTNKPFKILKNINGTVGINFENTSTGSLAFSAIQMGTDVSGGTKFTNIVYSSSGVTASGVYNPDGTSLINNGSGGLNFLGTPIRFYTGGSNGVLRYLFDNEGAIQYTTTAPTTNAVDGYKQYSADVVAGNAAPHFRTENGAVIKLYQETTAVGNSIISLGGGNSVLDDTTFDGYTLRQIVKALRNQGILQ